MADHPLEAPPYAIAPPSDTLGIIHVKEALQDLPFPSTAQELRERAGNWRMPITGTHFHTLREFLDGIDADTQFRNVHAVADAIAKAHPELRII